MAKKVRRKPDDEQTEAFEFPVFDENAFVTKEYELTYGLTLAGVLGILFGVLSWALSVSGLYWYAVFPLGVLLIALSPMLISRLRSKSSLYTKSDWIGLIALEFFGWLALWFVLQNLSPGPL